MCQKCQTILENEKKCTFRSASGCQTTENSESILADVFSREYTSGKESQAGLISETAQKELPDKQTRPPDLSLLRPVLDKYKSVEGSLITVLQSAQEIYGYLSVPLLELIAIEMKLKPADVMGVATFYTQFRLTPVGKHLILLCQGTACHVNGSARIEEAVRAELGVGEGEITPDGLFTYNNVACLGCCSLSPVMMIGNDTYGSLTPDTARKIIRDIKNSELSSLHPEIGGEQL